MFAQTRWSAVAAFAGTVVAAALIGPASAATVAYYRFEDGTPPNTIGVNGATDSAGGDDHMTGFPTTASGPQFSATVPVTTIAQTGAPNAVSAAFSGDDDLFDSDNPTPLRTNPFTNVTIESWVRFSSLTGFQTIVGRDDNGNPGLGTGAQSLLYFQKNSANVFRVEMITASNTNIQVNSTFAPVVDTWYHLAAVGDSSAGTLTLYVDGNSVGSTTGFNGMFNPDGSVTAANDTSWTIGRGQFNGNPADRMIGFIDEVRISDTALAPSQFLNVPEPSAVALLAGGALLGLRRRRA